MLRKRVYFPIAIVSIALLFSGCFSIPSKVVYDPDLPKEEAAVVTFDSTIRVQQVNDTDVKDTWYPNKRDRINKVSLPAGTAAITLNYSIYIERGNTIYHITRNDLELRFNFEAKRNYAVGAYVEREEVFMSSKRFYGIGIWNNFNDVGNKKKAIKFWELGEH
jgi:hypothetical protein